jgi:hypothetical protein
VLINRRQRGKSHLALKAKAVDIVMWVKICCQVPSGHCSKQKKGEVQKTVTKRKVKDNA